MVVTYDDKNVNSGQIIAAVEKAGYGHPYSRSRENQLHRLSPRWTLQKRNMRRFTTVLVVLTVCLASGDEHDPSQPKISAR